MRHSPFFDGVSQRELTMADQTGYLPLFYYDGIGMTAVFPARFAALRRLLPDPRFVPARLAPGLGVVAISVFEYRDTDIGPYNELAISVPLNEPALLANLPLRALVRARKQRQMHAFVHHLPVTTEAALVGGVHFYNYPKFIAAIDFNEQEDRRACRLAEGKEHILTLRGRRIPTPESAEFQVFSHLWMDRQPQSSEFKINALELGATSKRDAATLELGTRHPIARELAELLVSRRPIHFQYTPRFEGILYGPEHLTLPLLERVGAATVKGKRIRAA